MGAPRRRLISSENLYGRRRARVLSLVEARGFVTRVLLERELGILDNAARYDLTVLEAAGLVVAHGNTRARVYFSAAEWRRLHRGRAA